MTATRLALALPLLVLLTVCSFETFRRLAISRDLVAAPRSTVPMHVDHVPYLGGPAMFVVLLPLLWVTVGELAIEGDNAAARWAGTAAMLVVGLADDLHPMTPGCKLLTQSAVCSVYLLAVGPLTSSRFPGVVIELAFLLLVVNAFNLIDVMDGLLIVVAAAATIGLLGGSFLSSPLSQVECWALLTSLAVAFWFNRPHARVFLGDAGALALGFFLGSLYLTGASTSEAPGDLVHLAAFAIPAFELALLTTARVRRRASPLRASPDHFALRLQNQGGWTRGKVLLATAAIALTLDVWCHLPRDRIFGPVGIALAATSILFGLVATVGCWRLEPPGDVAREAVG